ncbi:hypothetical protein ACS0TY_006125 [Phlomoides rotata]
MKSLVSLYTGVTYDRSSIQRWLDDGNNTCPATMQVLHNKDLIPNYTLQRLIKIWVDSILPRPPSSPPLPLHSDRATELIHQLGIQLRSMHKDSFLYSAAITLNISRLTSFAAKSEENGRFLAAGGGRILSLLVSIVEKVKDFSLLEKIIVFINLLPKNSEKVVIVDNEIVKIDLNSSIVMCLKQGRLELRIAVAKFLNLIDGVEVKVLPAALLAAEMNAALTKKALKLLELMSGCKEGRYFALKTLPPLVIDGTTNGMTNIDIKNKLQ